MKLPKKCGNIYIMFDDKNQPLYGFEVYENKITKFIPLTDNDSIYKCIVLPKIVESEKPEAPNVDDEQSSESMKYWQKMAYCDYISGSVKIGVGCFEGIEKARIIVPFENSIMIDWGSFDEDAQVELVLAKNLALKQVYRMFDDGFDYQRENWTLVGDKSLAGEFSMGGFRSDHYSIADYDEKRSDYKVANFTVSHLLPDNTRKQEHSSENIK